MIDRECMIIGALLGDNTTAESRRQMVERHKIKADFFKDNSARQALEKIVSLEIDDCGMVRIEVAGAVGIEFVEKALSNAPVSIIESDLLMKNFSEDTRKARIIEAINAESRFGNGKTSMGYFYSRIREIIDTAEKSDSKDSDLEGLSLRDFTDPIPEDENPDALFRGGWFRKGMSSFLVSTSGSGKSVITMQFCYAWAMGRPIFGIEPIRPLTIGIFQTEDDEEEVKMFRESMRRGYKQYYNWTDEDICTAEKNIHFFDPKGKMGEDFLRFFRDVQKHHKFDLVIINPLQGVTGFDISKNENVTKYFREEVEGIIKHNEETKCGLFIVHHTTKPPTGQDRRNYGIDQYAQYIIAGASELNNLMRGLMLIVPTSEHGRYYLVAAKREDYLKNWKPLPQFKVVKPARIITHSEPDPDGRRLLFWHDKTDELANAKEKAEAAQEATPEQDAKMMIEKLKGRRLKATELRKECKDTLKRTHGELAYNHIRDNAKKLGISVEKGGNNNTQEYVFPE